MSFEQIILCHHFASVDHLHNFHMFIFFLARMLGEGLLQTILISFHLVQKHGRQRHYDILLGRFSIQNVLKLCRMHKCSLGGSYKQSTFGSGSAINMAASRCVSLHRNPILNYNFLYISSIHELIWKQTMQIHVCS